MFADTANLNKAAEHFALLELNGIGPKRLERLYSQLGEAQTVFEFLTEHHPETGANDSEFATRVREIGFEIAEAAQVGIDCIPMDEAHYPGNLRFSSYQPRYLFGYGTLNIDTGSSVAVIGTSSASDEGRGRVRDLIHELAMGRDVSVISGLARGIDTAAHVAALHEGIPTVAVVGTGLRNVYPPENRDLLLQITKKSAVYSQFLPSFSGAKWSFPERNKVMAGIAQATVVMESRTGSGSLLQARSSLKDGRPVFIHSSNCSDESNMEWIAELVAKGAVIFEHFEDIKPKLWTMPVGDEFLF
jgi:DNA processing protein